MFTSDQMTQLVLKINLAFTAQLEFSNKKQGRNATPTLRPTTPRTPTPVPADSPIKFWAEACEGLLNARDRMAYLDRALADDESIEMLRERALALKNEYRACYMRFSGDNSPEQANTLYQNAQKEAEVVFKAAYRDPSRNATEDAKAQFIASFTIALMTLAPISRLRTTTASSIQSNDAPGFEASLEAGREDSVEDIANTFSTITM